MNTLTHIPRSIYTGSLAQVFRPNEHIHRFLFPLHFGHGDQSAAVWRALRVDTGRRRSSSIADCCSFRALSEAQRKRRFHGGDVTYGSICLVERVDARHAK